MEPASAGIGIDERAYLEPSATGPKYCQRTLLDIGCSWEVVPIYILFMFFKSSKIRKDSPIKVCFKKGRKGNH